MVGINVRVLIYERDLLVFELRMITHILLLGGFGDGTRYTFYKN